MSDRRDPAPAGQAPPTAAAGDDGPARAPGRGVAPSAAEPAPETVDAAQQPVAAAQPDDAAVGDDAAAMDADLQADSAELRNIVHALLVASGKPLKLEELAGLFEDSGLGIDRAALRRTLDTIAATLRSGPMELVQVASGYRIQVRATYAPWLARLWTERPARYSRALLETLALVAYRQPVTRGEIEDIRGVSVSASIMKTLQERDWVRVLGHRDVPGRPALYGTTRTFLDDFNLRGLEDLPPLAQVRDIDRFHDDLFGTQRDTDPAPSDDAQGEVAAGQASDTAAAAEESATATGGDEAGSAAAAADDAAEAADGVHTRQRPAGDADATS